MSLADRKKSGKNGRRLAVGTILAAAMLGALGIYQAYADTFGQIYQSGGQYAIGGGDRYYLSGAPRNWTLANGQTVVAQESASGNWGRFADVLQADSLNAPISNGYLATYSSDVNSLAQQLGGNPNWVVQQTQSQEFGLRDMNSGNNYNMVPFAYVLNESGAINSASSSLTPNGGSYQGHPTYNANWTVTTSMAPTANSISASVSGSTVTLAFNNTVPLFSSLATYHYDQITIRNSSGQVVWQPTGTTNAGVSNVQVEGGSQYSGESDVITPSYSFSAGTYTVTASVWDGVDRQSNTVTTTFTVSGSTSPTPPPTNGWSVSLRADQTSLNTGQTATLTATTNQSLNGTPYWLDIYDQTSGQWIGESGTGTTAQGTQVSYTAASHTFIAYVGNYDSTSNAQAQSNPVTVTWGSSSPPSTGGVQLSITANPTSLNVGQASTLTATVTSGYQSGMLIDIENQTTGQWVGAGNYGSSYTTTVTENTAQSDNFVATAWIPGNSGVNPPNYTSSPTTVTWNSNAPLSVTISANPTSLNVGSQTTVTATAPTVSSGDYVVIWDQTTGQEMNRSTTTGSNVTVSGFLIEWTPTTQTFVAQISPSWSSMSQSVAQSSTVSVQWNQPQPQVTVSLSANPTNLLTGQATSLTATITNGYQAYTNGNGMYLKVYDETTGQYLPGGFASTITDTDTQNSPTTHTFIAYVTMYQNGFVSQNNAYQSQPVSVQWNQPQPQPQPQPSGGGWQCGPNDSETLTWWAVVGDNIEQFQATYNTTLNQGVVTGLLDDPGTPNYMWLPIPAAEWNTQAQGSGFWAPLDQEHGWTGYEQGGPNASQVVRQFSDGNELVKIFGSPEAGGNPMVYARPDSAFGLREVWTGSPHSMPTSGTAVFTMTNPDGSFVTWSEPITIDTATAVNSGDQPNGTNPPPYATEAVSVFTNIPKFTFRGGVQSSANAELAAWSLSNNPATVAQNSAHISVTLEVSNACGTSDHTINNVAELFSYPSWYFIQLTNNNLAQQASH